MGKMVKVWTPKGSDPNINYPTLFAPLVLLFNKSHKPKRGEAQYKVPIRHLPFLISSTGLGIEVLCIIVPPTP
jgi:hypothetical protein